MIPISNHGLKLLNIDQSKDDWSVIRVLRILIKTYIFDRLWCNRSNVKVWRETFVIDHLEVQGWTTSSCHEDKIKPETQKTQIDSSRRDESICISVCGPTPWGHTQNEEIEINRFWLLKQLGIGNDWHRFECWRFQILTI